jgi:hypothetical protein
VGLFCFWGFIPDLVTALVTASHLIDAIGTYYDGHLTALSVISSACFAPKKLPNRAVAPKLASEPPSQHPATLSSPGRKNDANLRLALHPPTQL